MLTASAAGSSLDLLITSVAYSIDCSIDAVMAHHDESEESLAALLNGAEALASKHVHKGFVRLFLDGAPMPPNSIQCSLNEHGQPYAAHGLLEHDRLVEKLLKYNAKNMMCKTHAAGNGSDRVAYSSLDKDLMAVWRTNLNAFLRFVSEIQVISTSTKYAHWLLPAPPTSVWFVG